MPTIARKVSVALGFLIWLPKCLIVAETKKQNFKPMS